MEKKPNDIFVGLCTKQGVGLYDLSDTFHLYDIVKIPYVHNSLFLMRSTYLDKYT